MKRRFRKEREFGLIVGVVLALLGCWWLYRGKFSDVAHISLALGVVLILLGLVFPRALVYRSKAWMMLMMSAEALAFVSTRLILGAVFFLVVTPIGFIRDY
jgi:saxitoxin biosynthesis operon SxtJ-like protein